MEKNYIDPKHVLSPKKRISGEIKVLSDRGESSFSICVLVWDNEKRIGIRWNGSGEYKGSPQSHGKPTWFILPKEIALSYAESIGDIKMKTEIELTK